MVVSALKFWKKQKLLAPRAGRPLRSVGYVAAVQRLELHRRFQRQLGRQCHFPRAVPDSGCHEPVARHACRSVPAEALDRREVEDEALVAQARVRAVLLRVEERVSQRHAPVRLVAERLLDRQQERRAARLDAVVDDDQRAEPGNAVAERYLLPLRRRILAETAVAAPVAEQEHDAVFRLDVRNRRGRHPALVPQVDAVAQAEAVLIRVRRLQVVVDQVDLAADIRIGRDQRLEVRALEERFIELQASRVRRWSRRDARRR